MINFRIENVKFTLKNKALLKNWVKTIIKKKKRETGEITFVFCSDDYLLNINNQYLHHDTFTDIITFDYSKEDIKQAVSGDIFISIDRIKENAEKYSKSVENELSRVIIHGVLHLLGYADKTKAAKAEMTKQENVSLKILEKMENI
jgi:rRNA maturation RNase YbeY